MPTGLDCLDRYGCTHAAAGQEMFALDSAGDIRVVSADLAPPKLGRGNRLTLSTLAPPSLSLQVPSHLTN